MEANISKKNMLRKVFTQKDVDVNHLREHHLNFKDSDSKGESMSHLSMDFKKAKSKQKASSKINSCIQGNRKEIYLAPLLKNKITLCYKLILKNRKELMALIEDNKLGNPSTDVESFKYHINFFIIIYCCFAYYIKIKIYLMLE